MKIKQSSFLVFIFALTVFVGGCDNQTGSDSEPVFRSQEGKLKLAVLSSADFFPDRTVNQRLGLPDALAARVIENLSKSNRFEVLERTALRKVINEQQFGQEDKESFLDRTLNSAIDNLTEVNAATVLVTASASNTNDLIKDYQNLGTAAGADYLVFAVLEKASESSRRIALPYSETNASFTQNKVDARLRLRIIDAKTGGIAGVASFKTQLKESLLTGQESGQDEFSTFDHLGQLAATEILNITFPATIVSANPLVVNRGSNEGFAEGSIYKVVRENQEITDKTGISLGRIKQPVGSIKLTSVQDTLSVAEAVSGSIEVGDLLELKTEVAQAPAAQSSANLNDNLNGKLRIAVGKIRISAGGHSELFAKEYREQVQNDLLVKLTNGHRFDVLDRQEFDQIFDEKTLAALSQGQSIEAKLAELTEADYLIFTSVNDFYIKTERQQLAYVDEIQTRHFAIVDATLRIVNSHTGKLLAADKIKYNQRLDHFSGNPSETLYSDMFDKFTTALVCGVMSRLYPIRIIGAVSDNEFFINRGEDGGLLKGGLFDVMREGDEMIDPDTGLSFGKIETKVAQVSIATLEASRARVQLSSGSGVKVGDVLRPAAATPPKSKIANVRKPNF